MFNRHNVLWEMFGVYTDMNINKFKITLSNSY